MYTQDNILKQLPLYINVSDRQLTIGHYNVHQVDRQVTIHHYTATDSLSGQNAHLVCKTVTKGTKSVMKP